MSTAAARRSKYVTKNFGITILPVHRQQLVRKKDFNGFAENCPPHAKSRV